MVKQLGILVQMQITHATQIFAQRETEIERDREREKIKIYHAQTIFAYISFRNKYAMELN